MLFYKNLRFSLVSFITNFLVVLCFVVVPFSASCSAQVRQSSEDDVLKTLRQLTKDGKLPPENVVLEIENRFANTKTGALAKLLRARIRFENKDFDGAVQILDANVFRQKTKLADYALWLRGKALQSAGKHAEAMNIFAELAKDFPTSIRYREAKSLWANSAMQAGIDCELEETNEKLLIFCFSPFSKISKSSGFKSVITLPFLSVTVTST
jgi:tetratricopeptide (TPR) repeat protein